MLFVTGWRRFNFLQELGWRWTSIHTPSCKKICKRLVMLVSFLLVYLLLYTSLKKNGAAPAFIKFFNKNAQYGCLIQKKKIRLSYVRLCTRLSPDFLFLIIRRVYRVFYSGLKKYFCFIFPGLCIPAG